MANAGSKGNRKKHSDLQKQHYAAHYHKLPGNKLAKLRRHIMRNVRMARKKLEKRGLLIAIDEQAVSRYKALGGKFDDEMKKQLKDMGVETV